MNLDESRRGLLAGGNFIIDRVKTIDHWPEQDALATVRDRVEGNGGGPYNVLKDLANLKVDFPLAAVGLVGDDEAGRFIRTDLDRHGINPAGIRTTTIASTSYTDVMTVESTGRRTFFHHRGANALLDREHFDFTGSRHRMFYLGYFMLLDRLDALDDQGNNGFARVLEAARSSGHVTVTDMVSAESTTYASAVRAVLPHVDVLVLNEWEAQKATGREVMIDGEVQLPLLREAARQLHDQGDTTLVVIHFPTGAYALKRSGEEFWQGRVNLPSQRIAGAVGAGDAFCAGLVSALHDRGSLASALELGVCAAASCLLDSTASDGVGSRQACLDLGQEFGFIPTP